MRWYDDCRKEIQPPYLSFEGYVPAGTNRQRNWRMRVPLEAVTPLPPVVQGKEVTPLDMLRCLLLHSHLVCFMMTSSSFPQHYRFLNTFTQTVVMNTVRHCLEFPHTVDLLPRMSFTLTTPFAHQISILPKDTPNKTNHGSVRSFLW
jgi:hypothetical protein